jgi:hypothetical protein
MLKFSEESCCYLKHGDWDWETGMNRDQLSNFEYVRDYGMLAVYSNWAFIKNRGKRKAEWSDLSLNWVAHVAGKRETRRLMGEHILTEQDIFENRPMKDGTCWTTWSVDLHYPMPENAKYFPKDPFRSICKHAIHSGYAIPYRSFYSRNIVNLFMAGRNISVTHVALGTVRVMRTTGMMGEVVGMAAAVCKRRGCRPRGVYDRHFEELKALMTKGVGLGKMQPPQKYNLGGMKMPAPKKASFTVDTDLPAGNAVIEKIDGDTVRLRQDLRDSDLWFYWAFRVKGAAGRKLKFEFTDKPDMFIDVHCPWIRGKYNEWVYTPWNKSGILPDAASEKRFSELLEKLQSGSMRYRAADDLPFGKQWNKDVNYERGWSAVIWASHKVKGLKIARTLEVPFANANGAVVTPETCRELGRDTAKVFKAMLAE